MAKTTKRARRRKTLALAQNAILTALIVLMAFTPIGYLPLGPVKMTFIMVPVAVGAITLGEKSGAFLGLVFGITSFIQCFGLDLFGTTLFGINPVYTFIMCIVPRVLMGYLCGVIYKFIARKKRKLALVIASFFAPVLNTVFFMSLLMIFFGNSDYIMGIRNGAELLPFLVAFVGLNGVMEIVTTTVVAPPVASAIKKATQKYK
ncbi:MAG: ECF transporter S component [Clostridia bacterium]|nr:ECF transporter S component [Oscillospiraceae bacterium]MBQ3522962.1 ECF transporter S component [Clostridia bacterium]